MFKKVLSLILLTVLVLTSFVIPAYADSAIGEIGTEETEPIENDRVPLKDSYTEEEIQAILSGDHNFDIPEEGIKFSSENFPLAVDDNVVSPDVVGIIEDDYYITVLSSGKILVAPNASYITTLNYTESEAYMWVFEEVDTFTYAIRNKLNPDTCLAASPSTSGNSAVVKKTYSSTDVTCHWSMSITSNGNYIQSEATGTNADGQYLYLSGNQFVLSSSSITYIGLVDVDAFIPCTSLTFKETYYSTYITGKTSALGIKEGTPTGANYLGNLYITYTISDTDVCTINSSKQLVGAKIGTATVTATHKMTGATGTVKVHVGYPTKVKAYYDYAFIGLCETYDEFNRIPGSQIEKWFEIVKKKYAEDLNIHLILVSTTLDRSLPEMLDADGNTVCLAGENAIAECPCYEDCSVSSDGTVNSLHHKNISNILHEMFELSTSQNINVLFTGHNVCYNHENSYIRGISSWPYGCAVIATNYSDYNDFTSNTEREKRIVSTIAHEIGHLFQNSSITLDHNVDNPPTNSSPYCIYGSYKDDVSSVYSNIEICNYCATRIRNNASIYNHR